MFRDAFRGRRVLVTGHTGFKGSWLSTWLQELGAEVAGYSVDIPTTPANFEALQLADLVQHHIADVRDRGTLERVFDSFRPQVVLHLAAQALVRKSYVDPIHTFEVNALGTANVLEAIRQRPWIECAVIVTSDKCYRNVEWVWCYREQDTLGGDDPYSGSKAAAEMVFHSYARSYFRDPGGTRVVSARAGNVIGGGDWAPHRLVPDCVRSWATGAPVILRNPTATRPWQHVLEPLSGYLWLAAALLSRDDGVAGESFNFGPSASVDQSVAELVEAMGTHWPAARWELDGRANQDHPEARLLKLSCDKALATLGWKATLSFDETVRLTSEWYKAYYEDPRTNVMSVTRGQIAEYCERARTRKISWALR